ncbi:hypothetical protein MMYC01_205643 [Madurella mycetomatis]|uniref:Uncharacterized protein n=1 Tax=Madurella mycetomatis TaxID=100816 RepID=A0A175W5H2_9PEZI|nr:hypothetical protein MMYC01_205643 [Madurella mycetomatis]
MSSPKRESAQVTSITTDEAHPTSSITDDSISSSENSVKTMVSTPSTTFPHENLAVDAGETEASCGRFPNTDARFETAGTEAGIEFMGDAPPSKTFSYHTDADLDIQAPEQGGDISYKICTALVAAASPVGRKALAEPLATHTHTREKTLSLVNIIDHTFGLDIVISITNWDFHKVPGRFDIDQLYSVARIMEQFDCAHLLVPFVEQWADGLKRHILMDGEENDDDKVLYLSWVLGESTCFSTQVAKVSRKATLSDGGTLLDTRGQP